MLSTVGVIHCIFTVSFLHHIFSYNTNSFDSLIRFFKVTLILYYLILLYVLITASRLCEAAPLTVEPQPSVLTYMEPFIPAVHYALFKLRPNPGKDLSSGVERQSTDYLTRMDSGTVRPFILPDYKYNMDDRTAPLQIPRPKFNMDSMLRAYIHNPASYILPLNKVKEIIERIKNPVPVPASAPAVVEYSPVSDWGGSDRGSDRGDRLPEKVQEAPQQERLTQEKAPQDNRKQRPMVPQSNGAQPQHKVQTESQSQPPPKLRLSQNEYDKDKMKQLLKLIQQHKKALVKDPGKDRGEDGAWDINSLKRKFEGDEKDRANKHQRTDPICNGESSRGENSIIRSIYWRNMHITVHSATVYYFKSNIVYACNQINEHVRVTNLHYYSSFFTFHIAHILVDN